MSVFLLKRPDEKENFNFVPLYHWMNRVRSACAYAFLLGISDYIGNYEDVRLGNNYMNYHIQAGQWADEYLKEVAKPDFSLHKYIGEEALDTAWWLNTL